jgi:hypothetical protein
MHLRDDDLDSKLASETLSAATRFNLGGLSSHMAGSHHSPRSFFLALLLPPLIVLSAAAAAASYETKPLDPGLIVMPLPQPVSGPESLAFDGRGQGPYSGVSDGRILRWHGGRQGWTQFSYNYKHK